MGFPRFKTKRRSVPSVRFTTGTIRVESDRHHVTLPVLGRIKTPESTRKLARRVEGGTARITSTTVRREAERWFVAFPVEVHRAERAPARPDTVIGVDLGITTLAVFWRRAPARGEPPTSGLVPTETPACVPYGLPPAGAGPPHRATPVPPVGARQHRPQPGSPPHREPAARRHPQAHHRSRPRIRDRGRGRPQRLRHAPQPEARADTIGCGFGHIRRPLTYKTVGNGGRLDATHR
jgi:hypothetical protein